MTVRASRRQKKVGDDEEGQEGAAVVFPFFFFLGGGGVGGLVSGRAFWNGKTILGEDEEEQQGSGLGHAGLRRAYQCPSLQSTAHALLLPSCDAAFSPRALHFTQQRHLHHCYHGMAQVAAHVLKLSASGSIAVTIP